MDKIKVFLDTSFLGNTIADHILLALFFAAALAAFYFLRDIVLAKLKKMAEGTETDLDDLAVTLISRIRPYEYYLAAFFIATRHLFRTRAFDQTLFTVILIAFTWRAVIILQDLAIYWINKIASQRNLTGTARASVVESAQIILKAMLWVVAVLFIMANLGMNVSAVLTGLGIGGVAVALAAQAILGDLFNFFVILLDKPFQIGDFVTSDAVSGTIEHIGLKSTRVRSISGESVIISNSGLLNSRIRNYKDLTKRRVAFAIRVAQNTSPEKLKHIPGIIKETILSTPNTEFERANLAGTGDFSLDFEAVYYVPTGDYNTYMDIHERVLLGIIEALATEKVELASSAKVLTARP